jgi:hypothetical protein
MLGFFKVFQILDYLMLLLDFGLQAVYFKVFVLLLELWLR